MNFQSKRSIPPYTISVTQTNGSRRTVPVSYTHLGRTKLVNIKNQDTITKILDMIPDVMDRFSEKDEKMTEKDGMDILDSDDEA